jgi:hypothetical protein
MLQGKQTALGTGTGAEPLSDDPDIWYAAGMGVLPYGGALQFDVDPLSAPFIPLFFGWQPVAAGVWDVAGRNFFSAEIGPGVLCPPRHDVARLKPAPPAGAWISRGTDRHRLGQPLESATNLFLDESASPTYHAPALAEHAL